MIESARQSARLKISIPQTRSVVAACGDLMRAELLEELLADQNDYGAIFLESLTRAYSRIKQVVPDLVIVRCEIDDVDACQLLSMLKQDDELSSVRVVTYASRRLDLAGECIAAEAIEQSLPAALALQPN